MQLSEENLFKEMKRARKSKQQQGHLYIKNMREIFKNVFRLQNSMEEKQHKQINELGGLWDLNDFPIKLKFQTEKYKVSLKNVTSFLPEGSWSQMKPIFVCYDIWEES